MNAGTETGFGKESRWNIRPAPSLRVPVTAANRDLLRRLRAAELTAWESGRPGVFGRLDAMAVSGQMSFATRTI